MTPITKNDFDELAYLYEYVPIEMHTCDTVRYERMMCIIRKWLLLTYELHSHT